LRVTLLEEAKGEATIRVTGVPVPVMTTCREEMPLELFPVPETVNIKPLNPTGSPLWLETPTSITETPEDPDSTAWLGGAAEPSLACTRGWVGVAVAVVVGVWVVVAVKRGVLVRVGVEVDVLVLV
jgi:hypothetical protein